MSTLSASTVLCRVPQEIARFEIRELFLAMAEDLNDSWSARPIQQVRGIFERTT
jgi:hypothetical protein